MIRFCFDWCCTDLNRPWPHVAEFKVQEISRNLFFSFKRIIGGTKIQSIISQEPEELDKASIRTLETEVNTFLMEVTDCHWQWWWQEWPMTIVACTFPCRWWPKAPRVRRDPRWAGLFHLRHQWCHKSHQPNLILPLLNLSPSSGSRAFGRCASPSTLKTTRSSTTSESKLRDMLSEVKRDRFFAVKIWRCLKV